MLILIFSIKIRLNLQESPVYLQMVNEENYNSITPIRQTLGSRNVKIILKVLFGAIAGQAVISGTSGYALYFMTQVLKVCGLTYPKAFR